MTHMQAEVRLHGSQCQRLSGEKDFISTHFLTMFFTAKPWREWRLTAVIDQEHFGCSFYQREQHSFLEGFKIAFAFTFKEPLKRL